jgi:hypothetical protein
MQWNHITLLRKQVACMSAGIDFWTWNLFAHSNEYYISLKPVTLFHINETDGDALPWRSGQNESDHTPESSG